jgi:hypothetical protein
MHESAFRVSGLGFRVKPLRALTDQAAADLWTAEQAADPEARQAAGVRVDVPPAPKWMQACSSACLLQSNPLRPSQILTAYSLLHTS